MPRQRDDIPSSRLGRGARVGGLVAGQTLRYAGTAAANVARRDAMRRAALERRHLQTAEQILAVLGTMKGPAMKLGQMLSFIDLRLLPEDVRPRFQERLALLCDEAPRTPWSRMEPVLAQAWGGPIAGEFREFDPEPVGTASIGQVYRAVTRDGREVAVKVQYPRIADAARADLKNVAILLKLAAPLIPSVNTQRLATELTERLLEELDYSLEARNTQAMAEAFAGHPFIRVPAPVLELCRPTVLVTEYIGGRDLTGVGESAAWSADRVGEILLRFYLGSMFRLALFSGDPHPGNVRLLDDGRVAFLDFGSFTRLDAGRVDLLRSILTSAGTGDGVGLRATLVDHDVVHRPDVIDPDRLLTYFDDTFGWLLRDEVLTMSPEVASDAVLFTLLPTSEYSDALEGQDLPVEWTLMIRTMVSTAALLGQLGATANWSRINREWVAGGPPVSDLGRLESAHFASECGR
jgi:predicted unusual protein kinase regulating ubiquinone biosynthesis (AarF/ABC1/UbiB family)